ncbi:hypothetical protein GOZ78_07320 [Agrobacterium vitis]|uniref:YcxB-like C-terminal domain-containing protein n=1 Tax=Agrobacterium vitis TaxID=373 RepID=A0ABD6GG64_AGRVI|nr:YcxB family protein [Agrobacterium vitis]MUO80065.1 hypothetical protein [Agrobacterium vitis]MUO97849.1 hypothetical protein [Agrobacterium vitis]MUP08027.1 hypothetical protein [Agrobacterium vitis]MUZ82501.1 hypothetical protein [Agrobacterium vitis]MVA09842.1 hypothetical protein [Agrobacterium vitis]
MSVQEQVEWGIFDTLTVDCQFFEKDIGSGYKLYSRSKIKIRKILIYFFCYSALYYVAGILLNGEQNDFDFVSFIFINLGFIVLLLSIVRMVGHRRVKAYFRAMPSANRPAKLGWDADGFYIATATSRIFYPWSDFQSWAEDKTVLALLFAAPMIIPLPKRALTDQQLAELKAHIQASTLPRAKLFPI